jgi:hypothetical protein
MKTIKLAEFGKCLVMLDGSDWTEGMERIQKYLVTDNGR